jgi:hypothetical protein
MKIHRDLFNYVEQKNQWAAIFNSKYVPLDLDLFEDRERIARMVDADLSPENLTCDGELPRAQVIARAKFLNKVADQLMMLDPSIQMYEFYTGE